MTTGTVVRVSPTTEEGRFMWQYSVDFSTPEHKDETLICYPEPMVKRLSD